MFDRKAVSYMELHAISSGKESVASFVQKAKDIYDFVDFIHLRERSWTVKQYYEAIDCLKRIDKQLHKVIINDRVDVAYTKDLSTVHLPSHGIGADNMKRYFPNLRFGVSVHSLEEAKKVEQQGASYLFYGHIYPTPSKPNLAPRGIKKLQEVVEAVSIPVIAIGGIQTTHLSELRKTGVTGIAVLSGIFSHPSPKEGAEQYQKAIYSYYK